MDELIDNYKGNLVEISNITLKIEIENYLAMIRGFSKYNQRTDKVDNIKTAIFTSHPNAAAFFGDFYSYPKLLTLIKRTRRHYPHKEDIFEEFENHIKSMDLYSANIQFVVEQLYERHSYNHIAFIDTIEPIKKDFDGQIALWNELTLNGIFDQWRWCAPFNRYFPDRLPLVDSNCNMTGDESETNHFKRHFAEEPMILLLRIYEINKMFRADTDIRHGRIDHILNINDCRNIMVGNPVMQDDEEFRNYRNKLEKTINYFNMYRGHPKRIHYKYCFGYKEGSSPPRFTPNFDVGGKEY